MWGADLMDGLALDLVARGFAVWNLEYRRPDRHGWEATTADMAAGLRALTNSGGMPRNATRQLDLTRVAIIGHSAGGQLALRLGADSAADTAAAPADPTAETPETPKTSESAALKSGETGARASAGTRASVRIALAVSLAGVVDLSVGARRALSNGAVAAALGGSIHERPDTYAAADPMARLPIGVPTLIVQGREDDPDLVDMNRRYVAAARAAGDEVTWLEQPGDHFAVIDPRSELWRDTATLLVDRLHLTRGPIGD